MRRNYNGKWIFTIFSPNVNIQIKSFIFTFKGTALILGNREVYR